MKILTCFLVYSFILAALALYFPFSGVYNVAASAPHTALVRWYMGTFSDHSVEKHSAGIKVPAQYFAASPDEGIRLYDETCLPCHGAPGIERSLTAKGLNPEPPELYKTVGDLKPEEVFWVIKNGIKMTGMPSFEKGKTDEEIWTLAAFVKKLPQISPEVYQQLKERYEKAAAGPLAASPTRR
jgi:mono/diheme cytochrome c family protein